MNHNKDDGNMLLKLFVFFIKISALTLGGGYVMILIIERELVSKKWLKESEFIDILSVAQAVPGPIIFNAAFLTGKRLCGFKGGLISVFGVILPPFFAIVLVASIIGSVSDFVEVRYFLNGVYAASIGMVFNMLFRINKKISWNIVLIFMIVSFLMLALFFHVMVIPAFAFITLSCYLSNGFRYGKGRAE